jgi:predicted RNase H-like HicB family nuclease
MDLPIILTDDDDGYLVAQCPVIPGCISQGRTSEEALANISEAIELWLENRANEGWDLSAEYEISRLPIAL